MIPTRHFWPACFFLCFFGTSAASTLGATRARHAGPHVCLWWFVMQMKMLSPDDTVFVIKPGAPVHIGNLLSVLMTLIKVQQFINTVDSLFVFYWGSPASAGATLQVCQISSPSWRSRFNCGKDEFNEMLEFEASQVCMNFCRRCSSLMLHSGLNSQTPKMWIVVWMFQGWIPAWWQRNRGGTWQWVRGGGVSFVHRFWDLQQIWFTNLPHQDALEPWLFFLYI